MVDIRLVCLRHDFLIDALTFTLPPGLLWAFPAESSFNEHCMGRLKPLEDFRKKIRDTKYLNKLATSQSRLGLAATLFDISLAIRLAKSHPKNLYKQSSWNTCSSPGFINLPPVTIQCLFSLFFNDALGDFIDFFVACPRFFIRSHHRRSPYFDLVVYPIWNDKQSTPQTLIRIFFLHKHPHLRTQNYMEPKTIISSSSTVYTHAKGFMA